MVTNPQMSLTCIYFFWYSGLIPTKNAEEISEIQNMFCYFAKIMWFGWSFCKNILVISQKKKFAAQLSMMTLEEKQHENNIKAYFYMVSGPKHFSSGSKSDDNIFIIYDSL